ncbi:MAG: Lrp/AsnC family transcriptional regulator [Acetobacteraceae bacterium]|nr:Lrp/AsnC family transcriptional regulator [Pseudomonadota bacterium]
MASRRVPPPRRRKRIELDQIDRRMIEVLQRDGRITNLALSKRVGLSPPPCLRRLRALIRGGVIRAFHADVDPEMLGWRLTFFALIELDSQKEDVLAAFEQSVATWPEVRECHMIRGGGDFLIRLVARDTAHENELTQKLTRAATVNRVQTLQTIRTGHRLPGVPI